ncbi:MAG: methenyltetrahydromethanopterin cyclohydrolase [Candidatus Heimdallarchaeaceae archaeon]
MLINKRCVYVVEKLISDFQFYKVNIIRSINGAVIIDAGISATASLETGIIVTDLTLGCLSRSTYTYHVIEGLELPAIQVYTSYPKLAIFGCQYGWIDVENYGPRMIISGPIRLLSKKPSDIMNYVNYSEQYEKTVAIIQNENIPSEEIIARLAKDANVHPKNMYLIVTPANSLVGGVQISARAIENSMLKLTTIDKSVIDKVEHVMGISPIPPPAKNASITADDMIIYASHVTLWVNDISDSKAKEISEKLPAKTSKLYGLMFREILESVDYNFKKIDKSIFAPATVIIINQKTGSIFMNGQYNTEILKKSIFF